MKWNDFVEEYKNAKNKTEFLKNHITTDYVSFETKYAEAQEIARRAMTGKNPDGTTYTRRNTPMQFYMFAIRALSMYTDIEYGNEEVLDMYNAFNKNGIFDALFTPTETGDSPIPQREYAEFRGYVLQACDDYYENQMNLTSYLDTKITAIMMSLGSVVDAMAEVAAQNADKESAETLSFPGNDHVDTGE